MTVEVEVRPSLFLTGALADTISLLREEQVDVVVSVDAEGQLPLLARSARGTRLFLWAPVDRTQVPVDAWPIRSAASFLRSQWLGQLKRVVVHSGDLECSAVVVARALLGIAGMGAEDAVEAVRSKQPGALRDETLLAWLWAEPLTGLDVADDLDMVDE